jgi:hypothetical protein
MKKVIDTLALKKNQNLLIELRDWIIKEYPSIPIATYFTLPFILQLGIYLKFFEHKNLYVIATPNSYAIDYVNYDIDINTNNKAVTNIRNNGVPYELALYNLNTNDILVIYEEAIVNMIIITNTIPF